MNGTNHVCNWPCLLWVFALGACGNDGESPNGNDRDAGTFDLDSERAAFVPVKKADGLAPTPPMGWNSWNTFGCNIDAQLIKDTADAMVDTGMKDAGYEYVNLDDCWSEQERGPDDRLQPSASDFPDGIEELADYVHDLGLKIGIYADRGTLTCAGRAGSNGYEELDAQTFAEWGIDYLKYDNCNAEEDVIEAEYTAMRDALLESGRDIVYSLSAWQFFEWELEVGDLWRTAGDIRPRWSNADSNIAAGEITNGVLDNILTNNLRGIAAYAGPNDWNDPDMLEVGVLSRQRVPGQPANMTEDENRAHFALWAIASAPLLAGADLRNVSESAVEIMTNEEVIAINQDLMGLQGVPVVSEDDYMIWAKPLNEYGTRAVVLLNTSQEARDITVRFEDIGLRDANAEVRDLWAHEDLGTFDGRFTANVRSHEGKTLTIAGREPVPPSGEVYLSDHPWIFAVNGVGPVERDQSVGATEVGDGDALSLAGEVFEKGLGVGAASLIVVHLGGKCERFTALVGLDDSTQGRGSVAFEVWTDEELAFATDTMSGEDEPKSIEVDLRGTERLKLRVTNGYDGSNLDRADWADAKVACE